MKEREREMWTDGYERERERESERYVIQDSLIQIDIGNSIDSLNILYYFCKVAGIQIYIYQFKEIWII